MNEERTPWFPSRIKPVRFGVYELNFSWDKTPWFSYWDGISWYFASKSIAGALDFYGPGFIRDARFPWRGLAHKP